METQGASVVITHHVLDGKQTEYEKWLDEILPVSKNAKGFIDWQIVRPIPNLTFVYTVIIRFDTIENLRNWMESDTRRKLIHKAHPLFAKEDNYEIKSGIGLSFLWRKNRQQSSGSLETIFGNLVRDLSFIIVDAIGVTSIFTTHYYSCQSVF